MNAHLAIDLGAESGRAIVGVLDGTRLVLAELHRFSNVARRLPSGLHWNLMGLWGEVLEGLRRAVVWGADNGATLTSVGVDSWGVDFGLIGPAGEVLGIPHCYRDPGLARGMEEAMRALGGDRLWERTGIHPLPFNTLFQLVHRRLTEPGILEQADRLLFMPDLMHHFLSGGAVVEETIASTGQMLDPATRGWALDLMEALDLPAAMLSGPVASGSTIGPLRGEVAAETGADGVDVVTPASHDTASAVAAVPAAGDRAWCFISSGTWSLLGAELSQPCLTPAARDAGFTNEGGAGGTTRFLRNLTGLWLVQECRRAFARAGGAIEYDALVEMARQARPFRTIIDPAHPPFMQPDAMLEKIADYAQRSGQSAPARPGEFVRCALESLALSYREALADLERVLGRTIDVVHLVGGGGRNALLNQMTADALGRPVVVGPHEATAIGNVLMQAVGQGELRDVAELRRVVASSFQPQRCEPGGTSPWDDAYGRYLEVRRRRGADR